MKLDRLNHHGGTPHLGEESNGGYFSWRVADGFSYELFIHPGEQAGAKGQTTQARLDYNPLHRDADFARIKREMGLLVHLGRRMRELHGDLTQTFEADNMWYESGETFFRGQNPRVSVQRAIKNASQAASGLAEIARAYNAGIARDK